MRLSIIFAFLGLASTSALAYLLDGKTTSSVAREYVDGIVLEARNNGHPHGHDLSRRLRIATAAVMGTPVRFIPGMGVFHRSVMDEVDSLNAREYDNVIDLEARNNEHAHHRRPGTGAGAVVADLMARSGLDELDDLDARDYGELEARDEDDLEELAARYDELLEELDA